MCNSAGVQRTVATQEAKYVERWPNTTSAWAGWSRFEIPVDRYGGVHSQLVCTSSPLRFPTCHQASQQENTYCTKYQKADRASTLLTLWSPRWNWLGTRSVGSRHKVKICNLDQHSVRAWLIPDRMACYWSTSVLCLVQLHFHPQDTCLAQQQYLSYCVDCCHGFQSSVIRAC